MKVGARGREEGGYELDWHELDNILLIEDYGFFFPCFAIV